MNKPLATVCTNRIAEAVRLDAVYTIVYETAFRVPEDILMMQYTVESKLNITKTVRKFIEPACVLNDVLYIAVPVFLD